MINLSKVLGKYFLTSRSIKLNQHNVTVISDSDLDNISGGDVGASIVYAGALVAQTVLNASATVGTAVSGVGSLLAGIL